jgi:GAF domain-containing protein
MLSFGHPPKKEAAMPNQVDYQLLCAQLQALAEGEPHWLPVLSNASALLMDALDDLNWAGFYLTDATTPQPSLLLGPFQGKVACVRIEFGRGVCGTAAATNLSQLVPNVHEFAGHIACDSASNSEVVVPIHADGQVVGVLDIDSPLLGRFSAADLAGLEAFVRTLERCANLSQLPLGR